MLDAWCHMPRHKRPSRRGLCPIPPNNAPSCLRVVLEEREKVRCTTAKVKVKSILYNIYIYIKSFKFKMFLLDA